MASVDVFEASLKEVVHAKRLSASKMTKLTEIALKSMEHDTQLVSVLYRTHKSLSPTGKVSNLYVFDALSRAARHQVHKQGITGDINSPTGNAATFLLKVEGVLEGLFQDMVSTGNSDAKEKAQKILDIWVKGNTFPAKILSQLTHVMKGTRKVPEIIPVITSDPRMSATQAVITTPPPPVTTASPIPPTLDPQATLLALLAQAANAAAIPTQTIANTGVTAGLDAAQLAVLQQLALAQTASSAAPSQPAPHQALPAQSGSAFPSQSYREESFNSHKDRRFDGQQSSDRVNVYDDHPEDRSSARGFRGGFRGRGRGRGRWDDRDRDRYRDKDRSDDNNSPRRRSSRSRSPPSRFGGRRDVRPYSPPRRPLYTSMGSHRQDSSDSVPVSSDNAGKDEFGRDIRPQSPDNSELTPPLKPNTPQSSPPPPPVAPVPVVALPAVEPSPALTSNHDQMSLTPIIAANTSSSTPSAPIVSSTVSTHQGLESFNPATFDVTSPASWEALGKLWQVTNGVIPSTGELMQFVMTAQAAFASAQTPVQERVWPQQSASGPGWRGRGRGGFTRGGFGHGNTRITQDEWNQRDAEHETDAIVLGGGSDADMELEHTESDMIRQAHGGGGLGGKMQRMGEKWVFTRDPVTT